MGLRDAIQFTTGQKIGWEAIEKHIRAELAGADGEERLVTVFVGVGEFVLFVMRRKGPHSHNLFAVRLGPCADKCGIGNKFLFAEERLNGLHDAASEKARAEETQAERKFR